MSRIEDLPPDLRAVLSLLVGRRKSYAEIAAMLQIERRAVHDRAHAALALLAPREARVLSPTQREQLGEYLLGQSDAGQSQETNALLAASEPARTWAQALAEQLAPLSAAALPEIPADARTPAAESPSPSVPPDEHPASPTPTERPPSSRRGGAIVLGVLAAIVVVAVVLIVSLGGGSSPSSATTSTTPGASGGGPAPTSSTPATTTAPSGTSKSGKSAKEPHLDATLPLTPPSASSKALGLVEVISEGNEHAFIVAAEHLPPTKGFHYAAWLYNTPDDAFFLGGGPTVGANGVLKAAGALPTNASRFATIVLTEEREERPKHPGPIVLSGAFRLK